MQLVGNNKVSDLNQDELNSINGGILPIVILGVTITGKGLATAGGATAAAGLFGYGVYRGYKSGK